MRDVALMPQGIVFKCSLCIGPYDPGKAADLLGGYRVSFVRHCGRTLLAGGERLFCFADFGALKVPDFESHLFHRGSDDSENGEILCVAVPLYDLSGDRLGFEGEFPADPFFNLGVEVRKGTHGARDLAVSDLVARAPHSFLIALVLSVVEGEDESKSSGLGMNTVSAPDHGCELEFVRAPPEHLAKSLKVLDDQSGGIDQQQGISGINDIGGGQSVMDIACLRANVFCKGGGKGNDVVAGSLLYLADPGD